MWYNSFRHLVKRSNRIHIQKKLLVLLQEAQLIYVVNFLYIFPLISLPCCPLSPFFFTTLRNSDVPAATSTGGECLQWCQPWLPSSGSQQWVLLQQDVLPSKPPWEWAHLRVPSNHTHPLWAVTWQTAIPSPSVLHRKQHEKSLLQMRNKDAFTTNVVRQALTSIGAQIPVLSPSSSARVWDELIQVPGREIQARGWAWQFPPPARARTALGKQTAQLSKGSSNRQCFTPASGVKCKEFISSPPEAEDQIPGCIPALISSIYTWQKPAPSSLLMTTTKENQVKYFCVTVVWQYIWGGIFNSAITDTTLKGNANKTYFLACAGHSYCTITFLLASEGSLSNQGFHLPIVY